MQYAEPHKMTASAPLRPGEGLTVGLGFAEEDGAGAGVVRGVGFVGQV